jgi:hypothetical protein
MTFSFSEDASQELPMRIQPTSTRLSRAGFLLLAFVPLAFVPLACGQADGDLHQPDQVPLALSAEEIRLARHVAEERQSLPANPLSPLERVYFIKADRLPGPNADDPERRVNVIHYRYRGDETIITTVDLHTLEILKVDRYAHFPTGLAAEEVARAERLARAEERLQPLFADGTVILEARPIQTATEADPLFGRRLVQLLLRERGHYRAAPLILVDLTHDIVLIEEPLSR